MTNYTKTMRQSLQEVLNPIVEDNMDLLRKAAKGQHQKLKMKDGKVTMDSFTASALVQIFDKVNPANKSKMEKMVNQGTRAGLLKLQSFAMSKVNAEYVPEHKGKKEHEHPHKEESEVDEGTKQVLAHGGKGKYKVTKDGDKIDIKFGGKVVGTADFDRGADSFFVSIKGEKGQKSFDDAQAIADYFAKNKITEEADLDEATKLPPHLAKFFDDKGNLKPEVAARVAKGKEKVNWKDVTPKGYGPKEEVEIDEYVQGGDRAAVGIAATGAAATKAISGIGKKLGIGTKNKIAKQDKKLAKKADKQTYKDNKAKLAGKSEEKEEVVKEGYLELDFKDKQTAELAYKIINNEIWSGGNPPYEDFNQEGNSLQIDTDGNLNRRNQMLKDLEKGLPKSARFKFKIAVNEDNMEEGAYSDARRSMSKDKDFSRRDSADDDNSYDPTRDSAASANILAQLRKVINLKGMGTYKPTPSEVKKGLSNPKTHGSRWVKFDKGMEQVDINVAKEVAAKYMKFRKPAEKQTFQVKISGSYRDMLKALREDYDHAPTDILSMIDKKLMERKND